MGAFLRELVSDLRSPVPWVLWLTISMAVAVAGPFGSYIELTASERVLFWTPVMGFAVMVGTVIRAFTYGALRLKGRLAGSALITFLTSAILCPALYGLFHYVFPQQMAVSGGFLDLLLLVSSLSLGVCALRHSAEPMQGQVLLSAPSDPLPDAEPRPEPAPEPRLLRRLEPGMRGAIWAISVRDHYVDVQTSLGKTSLLMRFSDAVDEVDCVAGAQVHRSHWVAWDGVGSVCREGGKMNLHLKNGHQLPVSRNNRGKVDARFPLPEPLEAVNVAGAA